MTLQQAERALAKEYRYRQQRYATNVHGLSPGRNCFNEENMARRIMELENAVEELGGDTSRCLLIARGESHP